MERTETDNGGSSMKNAFERVFLTVVMVMLVFSFPWLAFFPIMLCLANKNNK